VKSETASARPAEGYVDGLVARGRYSFTTGEAVAALGTSGAAARAALRRLAARGRIVMPFRGFHVVVPPEYRRLGCLPPDQFVPQLMEDLRLRYYVALLSAAQYHGAGHHRPQRFQVAVERNRKPIACGVVEVEFIARKEVADVPTRTLNTPRGPILVSSVEATALDLVGYVNHVGGLDHSAVVIGDLAEQIDGIALVEAAKTAPVSWSQRLGYILELVGHEDRTRPLESFVKESARDFVALAPSQPVTQAKRVTRWRLDANVDVDLEA
jgi:predicted transcriptional regulator of viral defense system